MDEETTADLTTGEKGKQLAAVAGIGCCVLLTEFAFAMWIAQAMALTSGPEETIWELIRYVYVFPALAVLCAVGAGLLSKGPPWIAALVGAGLPAMMSLLSDYVGLLGLFFLLMWTIWFCIAEATRRLKMRLSPAASAQEQLSPGREWRGLTR